VIGGMRRTAYYTDEGHRRGMRGVAASVLNLAWRGGSRSVCRKVGLRQTNCLGSGRGERVAAVDRG